MACIDGANGLVVWKMSIKDRAHSGLVLTSDLKASLAPSAGLPRHHPAGKCKIAEMGRCELSCSSTMKVLSD